MEDYHHSLQDFEKALSLAVNDSEIHHNRGNTYSAMLEFEKAISDYIKAISFSNEKNKLYLHSLGVVFEKTGSFDRAMTQFEKTLALDPEHVPSLFHLGLVHFKMGSYTRAEDIFTQVIEIQNSGGSSESHQTAYVSRGKTRQKREQYQLALEDLKKAVNLDPHNPDYLFLRGISFLKLHYISDALVDFNRAIEFGLKNPKVYNYIGISHKHQLNFTLSLHVTYFIVY